MLIEQEQIQMSKVQISQLGSLYVLTTPTVNLQFSAQQYQYVDAFMHGQSIEKLVTDFLSRGWLVSFRELYDVIKVLMDKKIILNRSFYNRFADIDKQQNQGSGISSFWNGVKDTIWDSNPTPINTNKLIRELPFFRSLKPEVQIMFEKHCQILDVPAGVRICAVGSKQRDMFALLQGEVSIYRVSGNQRQLINVLPESSIFGEGAFFLGKPRTADVVTNVPCKVARFLFREDVFGGLIDSDKAEALQQRFWVLHGLLSSDLFQNLPKESLDSLTFTGNIRKIKENELLVREGDPGRSFFIILQGSVVFTKGGQNLRVLGQGGIFGEVALMVSGGTRTATAKAQRDSMVLEISMEEFYNVLSRNLFLACEIEQLAWERAAR